MSLKITFQTVGNALRGPISLQRARQECEGENAGATKNRKEMSAESDLWCRE